MDRLGEDKQMKQRQRRPRISRRDFLGATAGAASALGLAAGGVQANPSPARRAPMVRSQSEATLEVWGFNQERLNFAENASELPVFKDKYPNVTVNFREFPFAQMHDKLLAALVSGQGAPDVAEVEIARFSQFLKGERVPFVPLTERIGAEIENIYKPAASDPWSWGGEIYGLGNELNAVVLTYRQDLLDELGVETPFETWDQVIEAGKQIVADGETKTFAVHDIAFGDWFQMAQHAGTSLFDAEGNYQGDNPLSVEAHAVPARPRLRASDSGDRARRRPERLVRPGVLGRVQSEQVHDALWTAVAHRRAADQRPRAGGQVGGAAATDRARREPADRELRRDWAVHHGAVAESGHRL